MAGDSSGWYARNVGSRVAQHTQQQQQQQAPPPQQQQQQQQYVQPQQQYAPPPPQPALNNVHDVVAGMAQWQGGEATRTETQRCPKCGGNHFFSRAQGTHRGPPPAPSCFDCGYSGGLFEQGDPSNYSGVS